MNTATLFVSDPRKRGAVLEIEYTWEPGISSAMQERGEPADPPEIVVVSAVTEDGDDVWALLSADQQMHVEDSILSDFDHSPPEPDDTSDRWGYA